MAWTATLTDFEQRSGQWHIGILYTNTTSGDTFPRNYQFKTVTKKQLRSLARDEVKRLVASETNDVDIPIGAVIDVTPEVVVPPPAPTQAELDKIEWFKDWTKLQKYMRLVNHGINPPGADTQIANLQASLLVDWDNSYAGDI